MELKPENVELVLTGRYAPQAIIDRADLVTEMKEIKHYYNIGVMARDGIEKIKNDFLKCNNFLEKSILK